MSRTDKPIAAKLAFEQFAAEHGVKILHYHCNNGNSMTSPSAKHATMQDRSAPFVG
jgi:hypothetical protein